MPFLPKGYFAIWLLIFALTGVAGAVEPPAPIVDREAMVGKEIFRNSFEGPYGHGGNPIQEGCVNNWEWGRKTIRLAADSDSGRPGTVQRIAIEDVQSGEMQFFVGPLPWLARGTFYRISFWMRTEGLSNLALQVRKIGKPWTTYIKGPTLEFPQREWTRYEFVGECATDVDTGHGVLFSTAEIGTLWLDDVVIEELPGDPGVLSEPPFPALPGNRLARSSCESPRDPLWTVCLYGNIEASWEDPQPRRVTGGYAGTHCLAVSQSTYGGKLNLRSSAIPVAPKTCYSVSMWMRATVPGTSVGMTLRPLKGSRFQGGGAEFTLTDAWQRYQVTTAPLPADARHAYIDIGIPPGQGEVCFDAAQVEIGDKASEWTPAHPFELAIGLASGARLLTWGESAIVRLEAWPASTAVSGPLAAELVVMAYPDREVLRQSVTLEPSKPLDLPVQADLRGLHRLELRLLDAAQAAPVESVFAVLPPPRGLGAEGTFGVHLSVRPEILDYAKRIGYTWVRCHDGTGITKWGHGEPEPGQYVWFDRQVDALHAAGFAVLGLPDAPNWPKHHLRDGKPVLDVEAHARWCEAVASHYRGRIDHWEIWNEPWMSYFWPFSLEDYGRMAPAAIAGIRRGNPAAKVLGACDELSFGGWKDGLPAELKRSFDIGSFHSYQGNLAGNGEGLRAQVQALAKTYGPGGPVEFWNTEGGNGKLGGNTFYTTFGDQTRLNTRATAYAARVLIEHRAARVRHFHYMLFMMDTIIYHGNSYKMMIGFDRSPTPAAVSNAVTAWCIDGLDGQPLPTASPDGVVQELFAGRGRLAWTIYRMHDERGAAAVVDLAALPAGAQVLDLAGSDPRTRGQTQWPVGIAPLFVTADDLDIAPFASACQAAVAIR